ncbi:ExbD/TolR family protein [Chiayiivirga flava]|uniref:Biopolymer transport protein ExbD n=1 Tax=Chiayiivirga flava TaxID=659595 RepID=A0A7W8FZ07_9GAMM|nr:biopolymer transporter ExbD [Chiayiivirga flava]MBB5207681.1 biopolymer transport protein ExbD [Chiayiivirga flava]
MAFATASNGNTAMSDINVTPLVDVMLVLLIIFMLTTPLLSQRIGLDLPQVPDAAPPPPQVDPIRLRIDAGGALTWNDTPLSERALMPSLQVEATREPQPVLEVETSPDASYGRLTEVLAVAKNAGMVRIGFVD